MQQACGRATMRDSRITYWTGWLSPEMEGISKEVFHLKDYFSRSLIFGLSRHYWFKASLKERYIGFNFHFYPIFRIMAPLMEMRSEINHLYGSIAEWFFLRALRRRPIVMTIAVSGTPLDRSLYRCVDQFVTHSTRTSEELIRWGVNPNQVRILYPGIDLKRFCPVDRRKGERFRLLFATAPTHVQSFTSRGAALLLDVAAEMPEVDFDLLWRPWGDSAILAQRQVAERDLKNLHLHMGLIRNMPEMFANTDATIAPFLQSADMKVCPTSLIESLACGRPILVSSKVGIDSLVQNEMCGEVSEPTVKGMCTAIERLRQKYAVYAQNARLCAERYFNLQSCLKQYEELYKEVLTSRH
jgi:glycosyltransferase involved in cell wall biosynthesis